MCEDVKILLATGSIVKDYSFEKTIETGGWQLQKVYLKRQMDSTYQLVWNSQSKGNRVPMFTRLKDGTLYHYARKRREEGKMGNVDTYSYGMCNYDVKTQTLRFHHSPILGTSPLLRTLELLVLNDTVLCGKTEDKFGESKLFVFQHLTESNVEEWRRSLAQRLLSDDNCLTLDSFRLLFSSHRWSVKEYYNVFPHDSIGSEVLNDIEGASLNDYLWLSDNMLHHQENNFSTHTKIPLKYDAQRHLLSLGDYVFIGHKLNNAYFKVLSLSNEEMRCLGPVMNPSWAENANAGLYIFR